MKMDADRLAALLEQAENDARRIAGEAAALRLSSWRPYRENTAAMVVFIRQRIAKKTTFGKRIDQEGGLCLERIVIDYADALFSKQDYWEAKRSLGLPV